MSRAGKEILIKAIVQAIPSYTMSCFQLPKGLCEDLSTLCSKFWWGSSDQGGKIHWLRWSELCKPKSMGGLGFRDLYSFNQALLAKQGWNIITKPHSLVARIFKAKYFPNRSFLEASLGHNTSLTWRSIFGAKPILDKGLVWWVGNGKDICIWKDRWVPNHSTMKIISPVNSLHEMAPVSALMNEHSNGWNSDLIDNIFLTFEANLIKAIPVAHVPMEDKLIWSGNSNGIFSVKSAYHLAMSHKYQELGGAGCREG